MILRLVHPRPPLPRARAPLFRKQKQRAAGAKLWSNHFETGGSPCILAAQATAQSPPYPIWTDPTNPARRPSDRPIAAIDTPRAPTLGPLGTRPDKTQGMAPPGPPAFSCFRFFPPSLSLGSAGPPTDRDFKTAPPRRWRFLRGQRWRRRRRRRWQRRQISQAVVREDLRIDS